MGRMNQSLDYYQVLEVDKNATQDVIHRAYIDAKETYSNDNPALYSVFTRDEAIELVKIIDEAYRTLSNSESRRKYDLVLGGGDVQEDYANESAFKDSPPPPRKTQPLEKGFAKTQLSTYKVDRDFEEQLNTTFDFTGTFLQQVREYKCITLEDLSDHTRISKTYLRALEAENFDSLPAAVFVRGFINQLAKIYGINEKMAADSYIERYKNTVG